MSSADNLIYGSIDLSIRMVDCFSKNNKGKYEQIRRERFFLQYLDDRMQNKFKKKKELVLLSEILEVLPKICKEFGISYIWGRTHLKRGNRIIRKENRNFVIIKCLVEGA